MSRVDNLSLQLYEQLGRIDRASAQRIPIEDLRRYELREKEMGSGRLYQERQSGQRSYISRIGDYAKRAYNRTDEWFVQKPYKGLGALGAIMGGSMGLALGPLGVLFGGAVVGSILSGLGGIYHGLWGRGKRIPKNTEFLNGRSIGKWYMDSLDAVK